ncbi:hypothetical protein [uncultured Nevskia sp.]|uniref:hypothetical protein n=1 Tax=uncultured Nevskia sp. TaxID=228950 RepID=UPI0025F15CA3|nr:hypothetical protein [uncultured Nevskia sp.]
MIMVLLIAILMPLPTAFAQSTPMENERQSVTTVSSSRNSSLAQGIAQFRSRLVSIQAAFETGPQYWSFNTGASPVVVAATDATPTRVGATPPAMTAKVMPAAGCCSGMMGKMSVSGATPPTIKSDLPGFPGVSHLYHVGATGFFLDYSTALKLSTDQAVALNQIMETSMAATAVAQRKIEQAEQDLWMLTASDQPDSMALGTKVRDIEKLRGDQRIAFIRAVGEAARILTDAQRNALLGSATPAAAAVSGTPPMANDPMDNMGSGSDTKRKVTHGTSAK